MTQEALRMALDALDDLLYWDNGKPEYDEARKALQIGKQALAQTQEPVAWITPDGEGFRIRFSPPTNDVPLGWDAFYTATPQRTWVGLTDDEIHDIVWSLPYEPSQEHIKAIEAKLKEKNT